MVSDGMCARRPAIAPFHIPTYAKQVYSRWLIKSFRLKSLSSKGPVPAGIFYYMVAGDFLTSGHPPRVFLNVAAAGTQDHLGRMNREELTVERQARWVVPPTAEFLVGRHGRRFSPSLPLGYEIFSPVTASACAAVMPVAGIVMK